jgi:hypothetical protein
MTTIFPFLVREMLLEIVIQDPFFVYCYEVFPRLSRFKIPVSHTSLYINYVELTLAKQKSSPSDVFITTTCHQFCSGTFHAFQPVQAVILDHRHVIVTLHLVKWLMKQVVEPVR